MRSLDISLSLPSTISEWQRELLPCKQYFFLYCRILAKIDVSSSLLVTLFSLAFNSNANICFCYIKQGEKEKKRWMCVSLFAEVMTKPASNSPTYRMYGILFSRGFFFFQIPTTMMGHRLCVLKSMQKSQNYHTFPSRSNQI